MKSYDIRNERGLSRGNAQKLLKRYAEMHPVEYQSWVEHEAEPGGVGPTWKILYSFIQKNCQYDTRSDITAAVMPLRAALNEEMSKNSSRFGA